MLDINFIRENKEKVKKGVAAKQVNPKLVDQVVACDEKRRSLIKKIEELRVRRNEIAKLGKASNEGRKIKDDLQKLEPELKKVEENFQKIMLEIPNPPADDVKIGKDETENEAIRKWGEPKKFDFKIRDHLELGELLDIIDIPRAAKVSGTRFGYLKNEGVFLECALVKFAIKTLVSEGFIPIVPPVLITDKSMEGMGYLAHGGEEETYHFEKDNLYLVGTSEQSIGPMHQGEIFKEKDLPRRYVAFSTCFRREAGSYGKDSRGIFRVHQFDKVEMFSFTKPEDSDREHEYLLSLEEKFFQALKIPYQVVKMCSGDLGAPAARKYDLEAWLPGQEKYREVTSTSTCTDFQARRLNIKYRNKDKAQYVHMLNGTAFAIGRTLITILENYQQKDGTVLIPEVLRQYTGFEKLSLVD
ncbi:serine--tRNA ligase [Candidatus Gottesmanbacteria bacterium]|nr:serine--tRNA ligase [Candidatus Gottesmanbacteria bacterium]